MGSDSTVQRSAAAAALRNDTALVAAADDATVAALICHGTRVDAHRVLGVLTGDASSATLPADVATAVLDQLTARHPHRVLEVAAGDDRPFAADARTTAQARIDADAERPAKVVEGVAAVTAAGSVDAAAEVLDDLNLDAETASEMLIAVFNSELFGVGSTARPLAPEGVVRLLASAPAGSAARVAECLDAVRTDRVAPVTVGLVFTNPTIARRLSRTAALGALSFVAPLTLHGRERLCEDLIAGAVAAGAPLLGDGSVAAALGDPSGAALRSADVDKLLAVASAAGPSAVVDELLVAVTGGGAAPANLWDPHLGWSTPALPVAVAFATLGRVVGQEQGSAQFLDALEGHFGHRWRHDDVLAAFEAHPHLTEVFLAGLPAFATHRDLSPLRWLVERSQRRAGLGPWLAADPACRAELVAAASAAGSGVDTWSVILSLSDEFRGTPAELVTCAAELADD